VPDLIVAAKIGYLWASSPRFEDHGGYAPQDLNVPLVVYDPSLAPNNISTYVSNRQVATTMLQALGLPLSQLDGYRLEDTPVLPGILGGGGSGGGGVLEGVKSLYEMNAML
jgi:hypothetical protein